ncbi:conserved hypothetical protein [Methanothermus fervidus DSM 2088]|uniref:DUF1894 domain-containing protein n=1 Tax=Methanothermus fervidus (strain ATCC 43054 / DSM 2088 / JCM 10308 / V24 S) TaxID=523846 RepID=E3GXM8_METFV|nr:DUF1894 domain-containing protein [Methanothermus fervidus]ADP77060.1 conserved hypothetical protein [Methanothermus fervidus DSM 2088]
MSTCIELYLREVEHEIHLRNAKFKDCAEFIKKKAAKVLCVNPGEKILGTRLIGIPPIPIGIDEKNKRIMIPYTKPCYGTFVIELPVDRKELENIKKVGRKC